MQKNIQPGSVVSLSQIGLPKSDNLPSAAEKYVAQSLRERQSDCSVEKTGDSSSCKSGCATDIEKPKVIKQEKAEISYLVEVEFEGHRKALYRNPKPIEVALGDLILVEAERGMDAGYVSAIGRDAKRKVGTVYDNKDVVFSVVRIATPDDERRFRENHEAALEAMSVCKDRVKYFGLDMKVMDAEWQFDHHRITFYFTAPQQVDFRALIKDLAAIFSVRIELRQISPRDEAKRLGGFGICGLELCCTTFLNKFEYITLDHAKIQHLANNPSRLSGQCGRLKCCLLFEVDYYVSALKNFPPLDSIIYLPDGAAKIFKIDIFKDIVQLVNEATMKYSTLNIAELNELRKAGKIRLPASYRESQN